MKILVFTASWCGPCKSMKPILQEFDPEKIVQYDIDEYEEMTKQHKISAVPTFVIVDSSGNEVERLTGAQSRSKLQELLSE